MRSRYKFADDDEGLYFITSTIIEWLPIFTRKRYFDMHNNPVEAGFVERPEYWIHSSASNYVSVTGILNVELISML